MMIQIGCSDGLNFPTRSAGSLQPIVCIQMIATMGTILGGIGSSPEIKSQLLARTTDLISEEKNPTSSTTQADVKGQLGGLKIGHSMVPPNSMVYHRSPHFSTKPTGDFGPGCLTPG